MAGGDGSTWTDPLWLAAAHAWIADELVELGSEVAGTIEQPHVYPWSTVLRVPTPEGDVYFKANAPELRHEAAVVGLLAGRRPDCVPGLLAVEPGRGWMLMADAGMQLRQLVQQERRLSRWLDVLPLYAGVQLDVADAAGELLAAGAPDLRLAVLPRRFEELLDGLGALPEGERSRLRGRIPQVAELCHELAGFGLAETIQHDDFHDGQVYVREGRYLLLDWGDACVSHPFLTLAVTLEGAIAWGVDDVQGSVDVTPYRDAYLEPFLRAGGGADLSRAVEIALRLGWACRAVNGHVEGDLDRTRTRLRMFLDGRPDG
jgi:hypothetical protein